MYDPGRLKKIYEGVEHGKARIAAIRSAIEEADKNEDLPFRLYFRAELCKESDFYGDCMDMMVVFPEMLAILDRHSDAPLTRYEARSGYKNAMDRALWIYKWLVGTCVEFYQIPLEDCMKYFEDFKRRCIAFGYNLKPYYSYKYDFYTNIDEAVAEEAFHKFEELPRDGNSDCKACERNMEIGFYLDKGQVEKAMELARDIENFTLTCGDNKMASWLRMKGKFMRYYMEKGDFEEAEKYCRLIKRNMTQEREYQEWDSFLYCYAHLDLGKALSIYKAHWQEWETGRNPADNFYSAKCICCFFKKLGAERKRNTIKLDFDKSFPLFQESGQYKIEELYRYYYRRARDVAEKFDARNRTDYYCRKLEEALAEKD